MKYDRPVWQLMHACADAMPEAFRYDDVRTWFAENYPEVGEATIRAHVVGLTEGGAKHPQFGRRAPIFQRVERGIYAPIPFEDRGELPEDGPADESTSPVRFTVVGTPHGETPDDASDDDLPDDDMAGAEEFWPFPPQRTRDDAMAQAAAEGMAQAAAARRRKREKDDRRQAEAEVESARRDLVAPPESEVVDETELPVQQPAEASSYDPEAAQAAARRELDAERRRLGAEREEMARIAAERTEYIRTVQAEIQAERDRLQAERAEAERLSAEQTRSEAAALAEEQLASVRLQAQRAAAAQAEAGRLQAERIEAERIARQEKKRGRKLRKSARKEREIVELLERDRLERKARRSAERRARDQAEQHLREAAERRQRDEDDRQQAAVLVRDELARLEQEAFMRIEVERAARARTDLERSERERAGFERAERERLDFEQLDREEQELSMTLRPMLDDEPAQEPAGPPPGTEPPAPEPPARDDSPRGQPDEGTSNDIDVNPGGIVIVRAPRPEPEIDLEPAVVATRDEQVASQTEEHESTVDVDVDVDGMFRPPSDAILLGSVGERLRVPAPARDAFRDLAFQRARLDAELSGSRWFVLSAEHGLLEPGEWMSPDERPMSDIEPSQRAVWASWVVARLESLVGRLPGQLVQVEAPGAIAEPVLVALRNAGAVVVTGPILRPGTPPTAQGEVESEVEVPEPVEVDLDLGKSPDEAEDVAAAVALVRPSPEAQVIPFARGGSIPEHLSDPRHAVPAASAGSLPHLPGLYAWTVDHAGSRELNRALRLPVRAGVIFVGQVGGSTGLSDSGFSLNDHVARVQLYGRARSSTFRMTLATALTGRLGLRTIEDPRLTQWMLDHLSIAVWPTGDVASLTELKASVVDDLRPVLNVDWGRDTEYRVRLAELGARLA